MFPSRIFDKCVYILFFLNCISFSCANPHRCWCLCYCYRIARICATYPQVFAFSLRVNNVTFWGNLTMSSIFSFLAINIIISKMIFFLFVTFANGTLPHPHLVVILVFMQMLSDPLLARINSRIPLRICQEIVWS